jgi:hypothetical protein
MQDDSDDMARLRAEMEQAKEGGKEFAKNLWAFYSECVEQGFDTDQAMALTITYMQNVLS